MALTTSFLAEQFNIINEKFFGGKLLTPRFEITNVKSYLGQYHWVYSHDERIFFDSVIRISKMYDRSDADIVNTLAHEMIHLYIRQNKIKDTRTHHGEVFYSIADRLNREGGFHISRTDDVGDCGLREKNGKVFYVAAYYSNCHKKYIAFCMNRKKIDLFKGYFETFASTYKNPIIFTSTDDKKWSLYPECRSSVRGYGISKEEYESFKQNEKCLYCYETLGIHRKIA